MNPPGKILNSVLTIKAEKQINKTIIGIETYLSFFSIIENIKIEKINSTNGILFPDIMIVIKKKIKVIKKKR